MFRNLYLFLILGYLSLVNFFVFINKLEAQEGTRIAPASGGAEIEAIQIERHIVLGGAKDADVTNMLLKLWFSADWKTKNDSSPFLVEILSLSPLKDDTDRNLTTAKRLKSIEFLKGEVQANTWKSSEGKQGPVISVQLDAPARGANQIKAIKGRAKVTLAKEIRLTLNDLTGFNGKLLEHADMKSLLAMQLQFAIKEVADGVSVKISAPVNFAKPWSRGRLIRWELMDGDQMIGLADETVRSQEEGVTMIRTYRREKIKGLSLRLTVLQDVESKIFDFDFQNVNLP